MKTILKIFLLGFLLFMTTFSDVEAQSVRKKFTSDIHMGLNFATMDIENANMYKEPKLGVNLGINFNFKVISNLQIQTGFFVTKKGLKQHIERKEYLEAANTTRIGDTLKVTTASYMQVPLCLGYEVYLGKNIAFNINVGGYAAYGFKGKYKEESFVSTIVAKDPPVLSYTDPIERETFYYDRLKRFDFGAIGSVGFIYDIYMINFNYEYGMINLSNDPTRVLKNRTTSLSLGLRF